MPNQKDLDRAAQIFSWNKFLLSTLGLWPADKSDIRFGLNYGYFMYHMTLEYLDLFLFIDDLEHVIMNLTENMAFSQIVVRMLMLRIYNLELGEVISEALSDFSIQKYKNDKEKNTIIDFNARSKTFVKLLMANVALTASSYYFQPILGQMDALIGSNENSTFIFQLPYRFYCFYKVDEINSYKWTYISQFPFVFVSGFGQSAADCLMVTLVYHVSGQLSVLAQRISNLTTDPKICTKEIKIVIRDHTRLLRMGTIIQEAFSVTLLAHLFGATSLVCILGYQILTTFAQGETAILGTFVAFIFLVLLVLYAHCTVGECLLTESEKVCDAFYDCEWYSMSTNNAKIIMLCMERSQKPLRLTAGKFGMFCLATLTEVIKTSMAYLSVQRNFL